MSSEGYRFDASTGDHILSFTETVPNFWLRRDGLIQLTVVATLILAILGLITGGVATAVVVVALGALILFLGGGWRHRFPCTVIANGESGSLTINSEYRRLHGRRGNRAPRMYDLADIASIERSSYADEYPDAISAWSRSDNATAQSNLAVARRSWVVRVIFDDGQEINAAWQDSMNAAAVLQKAIINVIARARGDKQTRQAGRRLAVTEGDTAL